MWLHYLPSCDSTNTWALQHLAELNHGDVVFTPNQTQGRGQFRRPWYSGGFTASFVLEVTELRAISLQLGLLVCRGLVDLMPNLNSDLQLKWPNDLMLAGRKLGGILCEVRTVSSQTKLVAGIGLNLSSCPVAGSACLGEFGTPPRPALIMERLRELLISPWYKTDFLVDLGDRDFLRHKHIGVDLGTETLWGKAMGINDQGELLLMLENNQVKPLRSGHIRWSI